MILYPKYIRILQNPISTEILGEVERSVPENTAIVCIELYKSKADNAVRSNSYILMYVEEVGKNLAEVRKAAVFRGCIVGCPYQPCEKD